MLTSNTMRFCTDIFGIVDESQDTESTQTDDSASSKEPVVATFNKEALLGSKKAWNCTNKSEVTGFVVSGIQPANTDRRFIFYFDGKYWKFSGSTLVEFAYTVNAANVLKYGNTAAQLSALSNITGFVGKKIYPFIALSATSTATDFPTVKLQLKTKTPTDVLTDIQESIVYELTDEDATPRIAEITADSTLTGSGSVDIKVKLRTGTDTWTNYMALPDAADKEANAVQFQITYKVTTIDGTDSAKVNSITVDHTMGKTVVSGETADLYSVVADYDNDLQMCYVVVRHDPLVDSKIEAYVNFMAPPKRRNVITIGTATGSRQEIVLGVDGVADTNIDASSIEIYADGSPVTNFSYNSEVSTVVLTAKKNKVIAASYNYNHGVEEWLPMTKEYTQPYNDEGDTVVSKFTYTLGNYETAGMSTSNVRIRMRRPTGKVNQYKIGTGTGKRQLFVFKHAPKVSTIKFTESAIDWSYNEDSHIMSLVAPKDSDIRVSFTYQGEPITIYSFAAGWSCA